MEKFEDKILYNQDSISPRTGMSPGKNSYQAAPHIGLRKSLELLVKGRKKQSGMLLNSFRCSLREKFITQRTAASK